MKIIKLIGLVLFLQIMIICVTGQVQKPELLIRTGHNPDFWIVAVQISLDARFLATGGEDGIVKLWDFENGYELGSFESKCEPSSLTACIKSIAFSADSKKMAVVGPEGSKIFDLRTKAFVVLKDPPEFEGENTGEPQEEILSYEIDRIKFSSNGSIAVGSDVFGKFRVWRVRDGKSLVSFEDRADSFNLSPNSNRLKALKCSDIFGEEDSGFVSLSNWNLQTGKLLKPITVTTIPFAENSACAFSDNGKIFAVSNGHSVAVYDAFSLQQIQNFSKEIEFSKGILFSPDNQYVAVYGYYSDEYSVDVWNIKSGEFSSFKGDGIANIAFSPDGKIIAAGSDLWNVETGKLVKSFQGDSPSVTSVDLHPSKPLMATGGGRTIKVWNLETGGIEKTLQVRTGARKIRFNSDGSKIVSAGGRTTAILDYATGKADKTFSGQFSLGFEMPVFSLNPDETRLAILSFENCEVSLWVTSTGDKEKVFEGCGDNIKKLVFSSDGTLLSGFDDENNELKTWEVGTGQIVYTGPVPTGSGKVLLLNDKVGLIPDDIKLKLTNAQTGEELASLIAVGQSDWLVVTPDGLFDGSPNAWKNLIWKLDQNYRNAPVEAFFKEYFYPGLLQEIIQGTKPTPPKKDFSQIDIRQPQIKIQTIGGRENGSGNEFDQREVEVALEVTENNSARRNPNQPVGSGVRDVRLFRQGSLVKYWKGDVFANGSGCQKVAAKPKAARKAVCKTTVTLPAGKIDFTAYAFNHDNVKSNDFTAEIKGADSLKRIGTMYVLAVGVNEYSADKALDEKEKRLKLRYAVADVESIGKEIANQQNKLSDKQYERTEVITLTDKLATKANVLKALRRFSFGDKEAIPADFPIELKTQLAKIKKTEPEDALIIYFAGHGVANEDRFYLIPHDGAPDALVPFLKEIEEERQLTHTKAEAANLFEQLFAQSISDEELEEILTDVDAGKMLMVIDACNSGQALDTSTEKRRGPMNSRGLAQLAYEKGIYILTASQSRQAALEAKKLNHGLLTFALLEGMQKGDANSDKNIVDREWLNYAVSAVPQLQIEIEKERQLLRQKSEAEKESKPSEKQPQTPRVFYRREVDVNPLVVAKP